MCEKIMIPKDPIGIDPSIGVTLEDFMSVPAYYLNPDAFTKEYTDTLYWIDKEGIIRPPKIKG